MKKILFVCLGNICRSACAEAVFKKQVEKAGLKDVEVGSAGISSYHKGECADPRMRKAAAERGYDITSISRPVKSEDFKEYDMIIGMDDENVEDLKSRAANKEAYQKIYRMVDFCRVFSEEKVPDPYYGGEEGFGTVIDIIEDACNGLIDAIKGEEIVYE